MSSPPPPPLQKDDPILIIGAGVFGLTLAHELASKRNYTNITVLDRHPPPVPDGSSVDISRIIRSEYADPLYTRLAREAIAQWRLPDSQGGYGSHYDESGFVIITKGGENHGYTAKAVEEGRKRGVTTLRAFGEGETTRGIKEVYGDAVQAEMGGYSGVFNSEGGWADAVGAILELARRCSRMGVSFVSGRRGTVVRLKYDGDDDGDGERLGSLKKKVVGVETLSGETVYAKNVVVAAGAWTNTLIPGVEHAFLATGQPVGFVQLTAEEAATLGPRHPVIVNMSTGVFCFPPSRDHVLKVARHGYGFATTVKPGYVAEMQEEGEKSEKTKNISSPHRDVDNSVSGYLPDEPDRALREGFAQFFPKFADRPWSMRRMCWYTDTAKGDFVVDDHPDVEGVFFATGGSGHGFKFLPVLGKYTADCFENKAPPELRQKWSLPPAPKTDGSEAGELSMVGDGSRAGPPLRRLNSAEQAKL